MFGSAAASIIIPGTDKRRACRERTMRCYIFGRSDSTETEKTHFLSKFMPEIGAKTSTGGARSEFRSDRDTRQAKTSTLSRSVCRVCTRSSGDLPWRSVRT